MAYFFGYPPDPPDHSLILLKKSNIYPTVPTSPKPYFLSLNLTVLSSVTWSSLSLLSFPSLSLSLSPWPCLCQEEKQKKEAWAEKLPELEDEGNARLRTKSMPRLEASSPDLIVFFYRGCRIWWDLIGSRDFLYCGCRIWWDLVGSRKKMGLRLCLGLLCLWLSFSIKFLTILFLFVIEFVWYDLIVL